MLQFDGLLDVPERPWVHFKMEGCSKRAATGLVFDKSTLFAHQPQSAITVEVLKSKAGA
jgi:hypothetical protein